MRRLNAAVRPSKSYSGGRSTAWAAQSLTQTMGVCRHQEEYQSACKRTERAESEALSAEVALRDERVQNRAAAAKLQDELDKCAHCRNIDCIISSFQQAWSKARMVHGRHNSWPAPFIPGSASL